MSKNIKTRSDKKGTIRTIDRTSIMMQRLKTTSTRTKEEEHSASIYATNHASGSADYAAKRGMHHFDRQAKWSARLAKEGLRKGRSKASSLKAEQVRSLSHSHSRRSFSSKVTTQMKKSAKGTQQGVRKTKKVSKSATKKARVNIKTAKLSTRVVIKMTNQTAHAQRQMVKASIRAPRRVIQASKATVVGVKAAIAGVKATIVAVKATVAGTKALIAGLIAGGWIAVLIILILVLFGGALVLLSGNNHSTHQPLSDEVLAHEPMIRKYAEIHGVSEHVELIMAVMMQESAGRGLDPMQASESGYNVRFPRIPNGITDIEYSIDVGIQTLASCFRKAEVEHPFDLERIKLGLQGYNFGSGYILWALERDGGYTPQNAIEYSYMMARQLGWASFGDINYVPNVFRFWIGGQIIVPDGSLDGDFITPFPNQSVVVTSEFGWRTLNGDTHFHAGIDLVASHQAPVSAIASGTVITARYNAGGYGNYITIRHDNGFYSRYAHLDRTFLGVGQRVAQGQVIGTQGNTGFSTGSHLHLEIRRSNGYGASGAINPREFINF